ncbi:MAG: 1-phosphofructokinase [Clostridia bacterium]|nr:1-phosphofructokinase [Clostridia bacterium]
MIYTLTFNPAIDYYLSVDDLILGAVNRTKTEQIRFGGKGINVSFVLKELGVTSTALGFVGGFTGDALENHLKSNGIKCDFVKVQGNTRINVKLNDTDINAAGPNISQQDIKELYTKLDKLCDGDFLMLSGSVPKTLPQNIYETILEHLRNKGIEFVVDAEKDLLLGTLKYKPFLIKPNHHELGQIFGAEISGFDTALTYAKKLQDMGAQNVMVTLGELGAVLACKNGETYTQAAPKGSVISAVGAGDSAVAAFLAEHLNSGGYERCLKYAISAGSATAFSDRLATKNDIVKLMGEII